MKNHVAITTASQFLTKSKGHNTFTNSLILDVNRRNHRKVTPKHPLLSRQPTTEKGPKKRLTEIDLRSIHYKAGHYLQSVYGSQRNRHSCHQMSTTTTIIIMRLLLPPPSSPCDTTTITSSIIIRRYHHHHQHHHHALSLLRPYTVFMFLYVPFLQYRCVTCTQPGSRIRVSTDTDSKQFPGRPSLYWIEGSSQEVNGSRHDDVYINMGASFTPKSAENNPLLSINKMPSPQSRSAAMILNILPLAFLVLSDRQPAVRLPLVAVLLFSSLNLALLPSISLLLYF